MDLVFRQLLSLFPAQVLSLLSTNLSSLVNSLLVGIFLTESDLVSVGFANPILTIMGALSILVVSGSRVLCGRLLGKGDFDGMRKTFSTALCMLGGFTLLLTLVIFLFPTQIAHILGAQDANLAQTQAYLKGLAIGFFPMLVNPCLLSFLQIGGESKRVVVYSFLRLPETFT